jgi:hypothetical protein
MSHGDRGGGQLAGEFCQAKGAALGKEKPARSGTWRV